MKKLRLYLDTSVVNFLFAEDAPEKMSATLRFFERHVKTGEYATFISHVVLDEINRTRDSAQKTRLLDAVRGYGLEVVETYSIREEIETLADEYVVRGIVPPANLEDALHIAIATVAQMDALLSWNYRHLANVNKERLVHSANLLHGYGTLLRMMTPLEVLHD